MSRTYIERVFFMGEGINTPGPNSTREKKLQSIDQPSRRLLSSQHFNLWYEDGFLFVQHPTSLDVEEVPLHQIVSWKRKPISVAVQEVIADAAKELAKTELARTKARGA